MATEEQRAKWREAKRRQYEANHDSICAKRRERYAEIKNDPEFKAKVKSYRDKPEAKAKAKVSCHKFWLTHKDDPEWMQHQRERIRVWHRANKLTYLDLEHWKWEDVEGYDGWTTNTEVHHRREGIGYTRAQLIEQGQYYGCRADELICCTPAEHKRIHEEIDKFFKRNNYKEK